MKKIAVITLHRVFNYGSVLQAYATQEILKDLGFEVEIVDYIPKDWQTKHLLLDIRQSRGFVRDNIYRLMRAGSIFLKQKTFWGFIKKNLNMTTVYKSFEELCAKPPKADIYCTGSDQVWNSGYSNMDPSFYLQFGDKKIKRFSYAASIGRESLEAEEQNIVGNYLKDYSAMSVREDSAVKILEQMGFDSTLVLDPTLQFPRKKWLELSAPPLIKEKYLILMLLYSEDNNATNIARKIADEKGLKLVKISWELTKPPKVDKLMTHRKPEEFISLFNNAEYVVTNSFHGLAFSINLNKQFVVVKRNEYNSRIESLLRLTRLEERLVDGEIKEGIVDKVINYDEVNEILDKERVKARAFLKESLFDE